MNLSLSGIISTTGSRATHVISLSTRPDWNPLRPLRVVSSLSQGATDFMIYAILVLNFIGSPCDPDKATVTAENHAFHCTTAGPYNAIPT